MPKTPGKLDGRQRTEWALERARQGAALKPAAEGKPFPSAKELISQLDLGFVATDGRTLLLELPQYYHPWDEDRAVELGTKEPAVIRSIWTALSFLQLGAKTDAERKLRLGALAGLADIIIRHLAELSRTGDKAAAAALWEHGLNAADAVEVVAKTQTGRETFSTIAPLQELMPAAVGTQHADRLRVQELADTLGLNSGPETLFRKEPRKRGNKTGTARVTVVAQSIIKYLDILRRLKVLKGSLPDELMRSQVDQQLFYAAQRLERFSDEPGSIDEWVNAGKLLLKSRYPGWSNDTALVRLRDQQVLNAAEIWRVFKRLVPKIME